MWRHAARSICLFSVFGQLIVCAVHTCALSSVVGIVTRLRTGRYGVQIPAGTRFISSQERLGPTQPLLDWVPGYFPW